MEIKNLAMLYGGAKSYESCKHDIISQTMKEYENNKLKLRNKKKVTNKKQAIAIALSQSQSQCKYTTSEYEKLYEKVINDLNDTDKKLNLSNIIETKNIITKNKNKNILKKLLWNKIIKSQINDEELDKNMWKEIKKINEI